MIIIQYNLYLKLIISILKGYFINLICCKFMKPKPMGKSSKTLLNLAKIT